MLFCRIEKNVFVISYLIYRIKEDVYSVHLELLINLSKNVCMCACVCSMISTDIHSLFCLRMKCLKWNTFLDFSFALCCALSPALPPLHHVEV